MSVMTEGCERRGIEGWHVLLGAGLRMCVLSLTRV